MKFKIFLFTYLLGLSFLANAQPYTSLENTPQTENTSFAELMSTTDYTGVPGYVNPDDYAGITCFDFMGKVEFTSEFRFKTEVANQHNSKDDISPRQYGFSIPLVGDLDGDKYPEILAIGTEDGYTGLYPRYTYLDIFSGQDGTRLARLRLDLQDGGTPSYAHHAGYHGAPSVMAVVRVDRNNDQVTQVVMAFPASAYRSFPYINKLVCYDLKKLSVPETMSYGTGSSARTFTNHYTLGSEPRWVQDYNNETTKSKAWAKPIPQIVDFDGDGKPEVLVYNKIYDVDTGRLLVTLEELGTTANVGSTSKEGGTGDKYIGFSYVYDLDHDGKYDIAAGGKVYYDINLQTGTYKIQSLDAIADGRTGVADINGDGIPDIVSVNRTVSKEVEVTVWDPGFLYLEGKEVKKRVTPFPAKIIAQVNLPLSEPGHGTNSYVYIGDIDGIEQKVWEDGKEKKYRLPEIAILGGHFNYGGISQHPNVVGKGIPTSGSSKGTEAPEGVIAAVTFDVVDKDLKLSFILGHNDNSGNTGFTMFDFDNDGTQEICYRDEATLRIIKASKPYISDTNKDKDVVLLNVSTISYTGFEYPTIADLDNDASAEIAVIGRNIPNRTDAYGFVHVVGNGSGDKFAPALAVWNQFMYDPFKINVDLTTPKGPAPNRLEIKYTLSKIVRNENMDVHEIIEDYNPFNGTLTQMSKFQVGEIQWNGKKYENAYEPIIFLTHAYFVEPSKTNPAKNPIIVTEGGKHYIKAWLGNEAEAMTSVSQNTPIAVYKNEISKTTLENIVPLSAVGVNSAIQPGAANEKEVKIPISDQYGFYILRLGDNSFNINTKVFEKWSWGTNDLNINDEVNHRGTAARAYRDCNWNDQMLKVSKFMVADDAYTLQDFDKIDAPILNNDILPDDFVGSFDGDNPNIRIKTQPKSGILTASGSINNVTGINTVKVLYQHTGSVKLPDGIDMFEYEVSYFDKVANSMKTLSAKAYFYILQNVNRQYTVCKGDNLSIELATLPAGTTFKWYQADGVTEVPNNPQNSITVTNVTSTLSYKVLPQVPSSNAAYGNVNFPKGTLTIWVVADDNTALKWTGAVNNLWYNPFNWSDMNDNPVKFTPAGCIDVTIPMVTTNYPELEANANCGKLILLDRAQISNVHRLTYTAASVELKLKEAEQNRWLMLSAPLRAMYGGDYKTRSTQGVQIERASYLSLYHTENPDNGQVSENGAMTRPLGKIEQRLTLGTGFMFYVDKLYGGANPVYKFPSPLDKYLYTPNSVVGAVSRNYESSQLSRVDGNGVNVSGRFIFEEATSYNGTNGSFTVTVNDEVYHLVVNPYPSYLNLNEFLAKNVMLEAQYKIWSGKSDDTFMTLVGGNNQAPRWVINPSATLVNVDLSEGAPVVLIAPYQAFFVKKKSVGGGSSVLQFNSELMTKTKAGDYTL